MLFPPSSLERNNIWGCCFGLLLSLGLWENLKSDFNRRRDAIVTFFTSQILTGPNFDTLFYAKASSARFFTPKKYFPQRHVMKTDSADDIQRAAAVENKILPLKSLKIFAIKVFDIPSGLRDETLQHIASKKNIWNIPSQ